MHDSDAPWFVFGFLQKMNLIRLVWPLLYQAFPRGSPMVNDVNKALLGVFESGKLRELEDKMIGSERCVEVDSSNDDEISLSLNSFWILFVLTGGTTTCALAIYTLNEVRTTKLTLQICNCVTMISKHWKHQAKRLSRKVSDAEIPEETCTASKINSVWCNSCTYSNILDWKKCNRLTC